MVRLIAEKFDDGVNSAVAGSGEANTARPALDSA
jgi:hypothetical protein